MQRMIGLRVMLALAFLLPAAKVKAVLATASHAVFYKPTKAGADSAVIEIYWKIDPFTLHYTHLAGRADSIHASLRTSVRITRAGDSSRVAGEEYLLITNPILPDAAGYQNLLEGKRYTLPQGAYNIELSLVDMANPAGLKSGYSDAIFTCADTVSAIADGLPFYSTLQLLDTVFENYSSSPFMKRGRQQFPNTSLFLDEGKVTLRGYFELYHADVVPAGLFPLRQHVFISGKSSETPLSGFSTWDTIRSGGIILPFLHSFNTATLPGGNYYLCASILDNKGSVLASGRTFYQSINKHPNEVVAAKKTDSAGSKESPVEQVSVLDLGKTFIAKYTPAQLRAMLKMIAPVASQDDRLAVQTFLKKPDEMYMRYFIYNFFQKRNPKDPNAAWKAYGDTVREANKQFSSGNTLGYETQRGSVFMRYGKPLERIPVPNENGALPYEIWTYNDIGRHSGLAVFLFYQPGFASGDMVLLHSTVPGEGSNLAWRSKLYKNGAPGSNSNSRAEQYLGDR